MKKTLCSALVLCALAAPISFGDEEAASIATTTGATTKPANTTKVTRGTIQRRFDATAYFEPVDGVEVKIRPKVYAGELTIGEIAANGAAIKKGATLLAIDPEPMKKQLEAAGNEASVAHANLAKADADAKIAVGAEQQAMKTQLAIVTDADAAVKWWEGVDGPDMIRMTEMDRKMFRDAHDDRADELDQLKKMYKDEQLTNATADIVVRRAVRALEQSKTSAEIADNRTEKAESYTYPMSKRHIYDALATVKQQLASLRAAQAQAKVVRQAGLVTSRAAVTAADQKVTDLKADLEKLTVTAPNDGVIWYGALVQGNWQGGDAKALKAGEKMAAQQTVMTLYTPGKLRAVADLPEAKYFAVPAGTKAALTPTAFPEIHLEGTSESKPRTPVMTQSGPVYPMAIDLGEVDAKVIPGMRASVQVQVPPLEKVLLVPSSAVVNSTVWLRKKPGGEEKRVVVTGHTDGKSVEILGGLREGDEVLTTGKS